MHPSSCYVKPWTTSEVYKLSLLVRGTSVDVVLQPQEEPSSLRTEHRAKIFSINITESIKVWEAYRTPTRILKTARERDNGRTIRVIPDSSMETLETRRTWTDVLSTHSETDASPDYNTQQNFYHNRRRKKDTPYQKQIQAVSFTNGAWQTALEPEDVNHVQENTRNKNHTSKSKGGGRKLHQNNKITNGSLTVLDTNGFHSTVKGHKPTN